MLFRKLKSWEPLQDTSQQLGLLFPLPSYPSNHRRIQKKRDDGGWEPKTFKQVFPKHGGMFVSFFVLYCMVK